MIHHDDNLEYRGGPPLFWEIYERNPVSGTILQILTDSLDGGNVIYRGHSSTEMSSLYRNRNPIYWKTVEFVLRRLRDLDSRGIEYIESLATYREDAVYTRGIYPTPDTLQDGVVSGASFLWIGAIPAPVPKAAVVLWPFAAGQRVAGSTMQPDTS